MILSTSFSSGSRRHLPASLRRQAQPRGHARSSEELFLNVFVVVGWVTDYDPFEMCQINACEQAANQSRFRETRLMLKLYYTDSTTYVFITLVIGVL